MIVVIGYEGEEVGVKEGGGVEKDCVLVIMDEGGKVRVVDE